MNNNEKIKIPLKELEKRKETNPDYVAGLLENGQLVGDTIEINRETYYQTAFLPKAVVNLTKSMATWAGNGFQKVPQHVYDNRISLCRKCQFWEEHGNLGMGKCLKCGCGRGKHWLPHEQCPIGLWGKEETT